MNHLDKDDLPEFHCGICRLGLKFCGTSYKTKEPLNFLEEGPVIYLSTYYLSHRQCTRQAVSRPIRLTRRYEEWVEEFKLVWGDLFDRHAPYELHLVEPEPPISLTRGIVGIVLIVQHNQPEGAAVLTTALFDELPAPRTLEIAHIVDIWTDYPSILRRAEAYEACQEAERQELRPCVLRAGRYVFPRHRNIRAHDGLGFVVNVPMLINEEAWDVYVRPYMDQWNDMDNTGQRPQAADDDQVAMMARRPRLVVTSSSTSTSSSESALSQDPTARSRSREPSSGSSTWHRTVVFALDGSVVSCLLPSALEEERLRRIATALNTVPEDVLETYVVVDRPEDLVATQLQCLLIQRRSDYRPIDFLRLVLLDLEITETNEVLPGIFRRLAKWLPHVTTTTSLLRILRLEDLWNQHEDKTHVWINNVRIDVHQTQPHTIEDGDYLKIYIGSEENTFHCGATGDETTLLQPYGVIQHKVGEQQVSHTTRLDVCDSREGRRVRPRRAEAPPDEDEAEVQRLREIWNRPLLQTRGMMNEPVMIFETWFISALDFPRCSTARNAALPENVRLWESALRQVWRERQHPHWPIRIIQITPTPAGATHGGHLLVLQHEHPAEAGILISAFGASTIDRFAQLVPCDLSFERLLWFADQEDHCQRAHLTCSAYHDRQQFLPSTQWRAENGQHLEIHVKRRASADLHPGPQDEVASASVENLTCSLEDFVFNPNAPSFAPGISTIEAMPEVIQDLHEKWLRTAYSWQGEEPSAEVTTWFVDQADRPQRVCWHPRNILLTSQFSMWEHQIRQLWQDRIIVGALLELVLVHPQPPQHERPIAAHVILVQRPQPELVTSLITVYDITQPVRGPAAQLALTTTEHIFLEHLIHSLGLTQRCLLANADRLCQAWYGRQQLVLGQPLQGRDGYGILMQLSVRPLVATRDHTAFLQVRASISRIPHVPSSEDENSEPIQSERLTDSLVAHDCRRLSNGARTCISLDKLLPDDACEGQDLTGQTWGVKLQAGHHDIKVPEFLKVPFDANAASVEHELKSWGIHCQVIQFTPHERFLCLPKDFCYETECFSYMFCNEDTSDVQGCILHTQSTNLSQIDMMSLLDSL